MLTLSMMIDDRVEELSSHDTPQGALDAVHGSWMEDGGEGFPLYVVRDETGRVLATVVRDPSDHEVAITSRYDDPTHGPRLRCEYVLDQEGRYDHTRVRDCKSGRTRVIRDTLIDAHKSN